MRVRLGSVQPFEHDTWEALDPPALPTAKPKQTAAKRPASNGARRPQSAAVRGLSGGDRGTRQGKVGGQQRPASAAVRGKRAGRPGSNTTLSRELLSGVAASERRARDGGGWPNSSLQQTRHTVRQVGGARDAARAGLSLRGKAAPTAPSPAAAAVRQRPASAPVRPSLGVVGPAEEASPRTVLAHKPGGREEHRLFLLRFPSRTRHEPIGLSFGRQRGPTGGLLVRPQLIPQCCWYGLN